MSGIGAWLLYSGRAYFGGPEHQTAFAQALEPILNAPYSNIFGTPLALLFSHAAQWLWTLAFLFSAFHIGDYLLRKLKVYAEITLLDAVSAIGLGLFVFSLAVFTLLAFHALYRPAALAIALAAFAFSILRQKKLYGRCIPRFRLLAWTKYPLTEKAALAILGLYVGLLAMASLAPEVFYDSLVYHLALPYLWYKDHFFTPLPFLAFSTMPTLSQLNYVWGFAASEVSPFLHGDTLARMLHFSMSVLTACALYGYIQPRWGRFCGFLAGIFFYAVPVITMNSWTSGNDVGTGLYQTLGALLLLRWLDDPAAAKNLWYLSAVFVGAALASKYTAIFGAAATFLVAAHFNFWRSHGWKARLLPSFFYGLTMLAVWSPWLIKNVLYTGNPLHPFLFGTFGGQNISDILKWKDTGKDVFLGAEFNIYQMLRLRFIGNFITSFWRVAMEGSDSVRFAGPVLLLFGPVVFFFKRWPAPVKASCGIFLLAYFFWFLGNEFARYLAPAYPCMALTLAFGWKELMNLFGKETRTLLSAVPLAVALAVWTPLANMVHHIHAPWDVLTGKLPREDYLSYSRATYPNPSYKVYGYANAKLPEGSRVLLLGDNKAYGLNPSCFYYTVEYNNPILQTWIKESKDAEELYQKMTAENLTHMIINYREFIRLHPYAWEERDKKILEDFWRRHVKALPYFSEGTALYEIVESRQASEPAPPNLILAIDQTGWKSAGLLQSLMGLNMWEEAVDEAESWVRMGSPIYSLLARLYLKRGKPGDPERAFGVINFGLQQKPNDPELLGLRQAMGSGLKINRDSPHLLLK